MRAQERAQAHVRHRVGGAQDRRPRRARSSGERDRERRRSRRAVRRYAGKPAARDDVSPSIGAMPVRRHAEDAEHRDALGAPRRRRQVGRVGEVGREERAPHDGVHGRPDVEPRARRCARQRNGSQETTFSDAGAEQHAAGGRRDRAARRRSGRVATLAAVPTPSTRPIVELAPAELAARAAGTATNMARLIAPVKWTAHARPERRACRAAAARLTRRCGAR